MSMHRIDVAIETLRPGDEGYDASARGFFATGRPAVVVRPRHPDEIAAALAQASADDLAVSVRSGGHGPLRPDPDTAEMMIDLAHLGDVEVIDGRRRLVRVGGGATWGRVAAALDPLGWAITAGDTNDVGVGGLTLGGGIGWLVRRDGLAIDNLVGARVVTADGRFLTTSQDQHPDLFWALRGGGGNFGVVVDFDFRAQPVGTVRFGTIAYRLDDPADLVARWRDAMRDAPEALSSTLVLVPRAPGTAPAAMVLVCHADRPGTATVGADAAIDPLLGLGAVTAVSIAERRYCEILEDAAPPPRPRLVVRNTLVAALDDPVIAAVTRFHGGKMPAVVAIRSLGGAFGRVPADATAFAHRQAEAMIVALMMVPQATDEHDLAQALLAWRGVGDRGIGTYVNFQGSATPSDLAAAYPPATLARLAAVKGAYDPGNRFARNHNIAPSTPEEET